MKLIRYIMSYLLLIAFIILLVLAYFYRSQLFPADVVAKIDAVSEKAMFWKKTDQVSVASSETEPSATTAQNTEPVQSAEKESPATSAETSVAPAQTMAESEPVMPVPHESTSEESTSPPAESSASLSARSDAEGQTAEPSAQTPADDEATDSLGQARGDFADGNVEEAIDRYQALAKLDPANPNVFGELGNVYYSQGKWKDAGKAYYEAAIRLLQLGDIAQVEYLYRVIQGLDEDSAAKLKQRLVSH